MRRPIRLAAAALLAAGLLAPAARAQTYRDGPPPQHRLVYRSLEVLRWNPIGLQSENKLAYRLRLFESEKAALRDNFVSVALTPVVSGAFARLGVQAELQPASFLNLWASYEHVGYFGTFNLFQSYASPTSDYSETEWRRRGALEAGAPQRHYATSGSQLNLGANLTLKFGDVVVRDQFRLMRADMRLRRGDKVFYDITYDLLAADGGWFFANDADLLVQRGNLTAGLRWYAARATYRDADFAPGEAREAAPGTIHRAGPLLAYTWRKPDGAAFEPTVLLVVNLWLRNPYRTGADVSQAVPFLVLGYSMTGDLL